MTVRTEAAVELAAHWGAAVAPGEVFVEHQDRAVMRCLDPVGRPVVVKADRDGGRLRREVQALSAARAAGVPVPAVHEWIDGPPAMVVLDHVEGRPLASTSPDGHWRAVARELRRLHDDAPADGWPWFGGGEGWWSQLRWLADWAGQWCRERGMLAPAVLDRIRRRVDAGLARDDELDGRLVHGDCGPYHWLLRDDTVVAVVDFGDTGRGDPVWDLAVLTLWDRDRLPAVLDGYGADGALRARVEALLRPYVLVRHLLAIPWMVEHDTDPTPTIDELDRLH